MGKLTKSGFSTAVSEGHISEVGADVLSGIVGFEALGLPAAVAAKGLGGSARASGPGSTGAAASGGFVLYPSKPNLNAIESVYSK